jgi:hypothetical protein
VSGQHARAPACWAAACFVPRESDLLALSCLSTALRYRILFWRAIRFLRSNLDRKCRAGLLSP